MSENEHKRELEKELSQVVEIESSEKIYLIEIEYIGPNRESKGRRAHMIRVLGSPDHTNLSREPRTRGYLGTTNDWYKRALGEFTPNEALTYLAGEWGIETKNIQVGEEFFIQ